MLQITENEILEAFDKFELSEEELIEMGIFDELIMESEEDLVLEEAEELEEGKITRGIREIGHQAVKHIIQPLLSRNYKRDAYAHELKHVRRQLNDAKREGNSKAIEKLKNRAASISKKAIMLVLDMFICRHTVKCQADLQFILVLKIIMFLDQNMM